MGSSDGTCGATGAGGGNADLDWNRRCGACFWTVNVALLAVSIPYEAKRAVCTRWISSGSKEPSPSPWSRSTVGPCRPSSTAEPGHPTRSTTAKTERRPVADVVPEWCAIQPEYILFQGRAHLAESVQEYKTTLPGLRYLTTIQSSRIDRWLERINPINSSERIMIYAVDDALGCP